MDGITLLSMPLRHKGMHSMHGTKENGVDLKFHPAAPILSVLLKKNVFHFFPGSIELGVLKWDEEPF